MKRFLFFALLLLSTVQLHASLRQTKYRWRNDNGNEANATWMAAENTPVMVLSNAPSIRLRIEYDNDNGTAFSSSITETLEYSDDGGATWILIDGSPGNAFAYTTSTFVTNGTATTNQMPPGTLGTFVPGRIITAPSGSPMDLNDGERTEMEWVIKPTADAVPGATYQFRSSDLEDVSLQTPELTIMPICDGPPNAGTVNVSMPIVECNATTELTNVGSTQAYGIDYQWQYGIDGVWTDFGANSITETSPPVVRNMQFRCILTCNLTGDSDTTPVVNVKAQPLPVDLGDDINACVDSGVQIVLDAGVLPNNPRYVWDNGSISQVRAVKESGTYFVKVTNQFTCVGFDTISVLLKDNPVVNLGNDTSVCNGALLPLDAGTDGISYYWNTGITSQVLVANQPGSYYVFVTNNLGCIKSDTIQVSMSGELPTVDGINITNNGINTFHFTAMNPQYVIGYDWDFGDGSAHSFKEAPTHTYATNPANYVVVLRLSSSCGFVNDSTAAHIVGIRQLNVSNEEMALYPNPARSTATIQNHGALKMEQITLYNVLGQVVYHAPADSRDKHTLNLKGLAGGIYTVQIATDKGTVARKLQLTP